MTPLKSIAMVTLLSLAALLPACGKNRKIYPDVMPGWHSGSYDIIFGRLQRIPAKDPVDAPMWAIRYGLSNSTDPYRGELALVPPEKLVGYSGGELVEIRGNIDPSLKSPNYIGTFYNVQAVRIWNGQLNR